MRSDAICAIVCAILLSAIGTPAEAQSAAKRYFPPCSQLGPSYEADCYRDFGEVEQFLHDAAAGYPNLAKLESIGKSYQGRDLWVLTITDSQNGAAENKPGIWVDGGIDADEVIGIEAALGLVQRLLTSSEPRVQELLRTRAFYVAPAVIPDSSELHMTTAERPDDTTLRPWDDDNDGVADEDGPEDLDGDGEALAMRQLDPNGRWTLDEDDPRLLRERLPGDPGPFYERWEEGIDNDGDGRYQEDRLGGVDPNRNYPGQWSTSQRGNGPFASSEVEIRAMMDFLLAHPNIAASQHLHSNGGVILRPPSVPDWRLPPSDERLYLKLAERGLEVTGYDLATPVYDWNWPRGSRNTKRGQVWRDREGQIRGGPRSGDTYAAYGGSIDTLYEMFGILAFANEIYQLGKDDDGDGRIEDHERLRANDEELGGKAFKEWAPFEHPQLGSVEIGGWRKFGQNNPLPPRLAEEVRRNVEFVLLQAESTPLLSIAEAELVALGEGLYRLEATVANVGFSPTELQIRIEQGRAVPVRAQVAGDGVEVLSSRSQQELGQLGGWSEKEAEWVLRAPPGTEVVLSAWHPKAGRAKAILPTG